MRENKNINYPVHLPLLTSAFTRDGRSCITDKHTTLQHYDQFIKTQMPEIGKEYAFHNGRLWEKGELRHFIYNHNCVANKIREIQLPTEEEIEHAKEILIRSGLWK